MRIQHNIMAMNAYRNYTNNVSAMKKNLEKLSSGYKINRAGDDAAGLAISEKMRAQITGLKQAQNNAKSGINLVQTAEGALTEVHDMLNRMFKLAEQSANGTYDDDVDRNQLQKEVTQLKDEINRIADSANFNGIKLLDGSLDGSSSKTEITGMKDIALTAKSDATLDKVEAQAGRWEVDLSKIKFTSASGNDTKMTITVGGKAIGAITIAGTVSGKADEVVTMFTEDSFKVTATQIKVNGASLNVSFEDGKLIVEMNQAPTTTGANNAGSIPNNVTLSFGTALPKSVTWNLSDGKTLTAGQNDIQMTQTQEARVASKDRLYATAKFTLTDDMVKDGNSIKIGDEVYTFAVGKDSKFKGGDKVIDLTAYEKDDIVATRTNGKISLTEIVGKLSEVAKDNKQWNVGTDGATATVTLTEKEGSGLNYKGSQIVGDSNDTLTDGKWKGIVQQGQASVQQGKGGLILQIGDTAEDFNQLSVSVKDMHTKAMGIGDVDISKQGQAQSAMDAIKQAINYVSDARGTLGATQNRLDHTINNLSVMEENIQDAESTIRDTDVADEMMAYTKNNILIQSAQAMLAQANQVPQGVLQLLQ